MAPLAPNRYEFRFTGTAELRDLVELAADMLGHTVPSGNLADIFQRAVKLLVEDLTKKKFGATESPRPSRGTAPGSRHIPAEVRRAVWLRDLGRCAFVGQDGRRCGQRRFLEFHHLQPYAAGGQATVTNLSLRCAAHNAHEADLFYGPGRPFGAAGVFRSGTAMAAKPQPP